MNIDIIILGAVIGTAIIWAIIGWDTYEQVKLNALRSRPYKSSHNKTSIESLHNRIAKLEFQVAHMEWADAVSKIHFRKIAKYKDYIKNRKVKK